MEDKRTLMVVHAHPDDEVFSTGGILAKYAAAGDRVVVVYCTSGEAGEMFHPDLDPSDAVPRMGELRQEEARAACAVLGVTDVYFLGYRDSGMKDWEQNKHPDAFMNAPLDESSGRLLDIIREVRPDVMVTYDEGGGYGHPDHVMTHTISLEAFNRARIEGNAPKKLYYSARSRESFRRWATGLRKYDLRISWLKDDFDFDQYGASDDAITAHIDVAQFTPLKKRALAIHRTQIKSDHFYLQVPDEALSELQGMEFFLRVFPAPAPGEREESLFEGIESDKAVA